MKRCWGLYACSSRDAPFMLMTRFAVASSSLLLALLSATVNAQTQTTYACSSSVSISFPVSANATSGILTHSLSKYTKKGTACSMLIQPPRQAGVDNFLYLDFAFVRLDSLDSISVYAGTNTGAPLLGSFNTAPSGRLFNTSAAALLVTFTTSLNADM